MKMNKGEEVPPHPDDLEAWQQAIQDDRLPLFRLEDVVGAIQTLGPNSDQSVVTTLVLHASTAILHILRQCIGKNHQNRGEDIIEEAHGMLIEAMLKPESADGKALREAFKPRVRFRAADAIRANIKLRKREISTQHTEALSDARFADEQGHQREQDEAIFVEEVLSRITDDRKRLAFRLHVDGIPLISKRTISIAGTLGVSSKTAGKWIEEVRGQLIHILGELK